MSGPVACTSVMTPRDGCILGDRQPDETVDLAVRNANKHVHCLAYRLRDEREGYCEAERFGMKGKGCAGSMASGVRSGKILAKEVILKPGALFLFADIRSSTRTMPFLQRERAWMLAPTLLLIARQARPTVSQRCARVAERGGAHPGFLMLDARPQQPFQAGHTDHEELVQIVRRDR